VTTPRKALSERVYKVGISREARQKWLDAIALGASKARAAELAGVARQRFAERLAMDADFRALYEEAVEQAADAAEDELAERSREGFEEVVLDGDGNVIRRTVRKHPQDLHLRLKALRPEKYRENTQVAVVNSYEQPVITHERGKTLADLFEFVRANNLETSMGETLALGQRALPPGRSEVVDIDETGGES
jgi:hypothetical protein